MGGGRSPRRAPRVSKSSLSTKADQKAGRGNKADAGFEVRGQIDDGSNSRFTRGSVRVSGKAGPHLASVLSPASLVRGEQYEVRLVVGAHWLVGCGGWRVGGAVLNSRVAAAVGGASGGRSRRGRGVLVAGLILLLLVEAQADVALQGGRGQPLLGQAALKEGDAGAEVGQSVHPAGDLPSTQQLREEWEDMLSEN